MQNAGRVRSREANRVGLVTTRDFRDASIRRGEREGDGKSCLLSWVELCGPGLSADRARFSCAARRVGRDRDPTNQEQGMALACSSVEAARTSLLVGKELP
jgi:hypothetical protein